MAEYDLITGDLLPESTAARANNTATAAPLDPVSAATLSLLEQMSREELVGVIKRVCNARWGEVALMSKQERVEAGKLKLWHSGLTLADVYKALPMLKEAFDRDEGRASQNVNMNVEVSSLSKMSDERLLRLERELAKATGQEALVINQIPVKLE